MSSVSTDFLKIQKNIQWYNSFFNSKVYIFIGKPSSWAINENEDSFIVPTPSFNDQSMKDDLKDIIALKKVSASDVCLGIKRYDWQYGSFYDSYDAHDNNQLKKHFFPSTHPFYVMTDEYNVYKCIDNNNTLSLVKPSGQFLINQTLSDGYIWKFMFNVPEELRVKFLSTQYIPVLQNADVQQSSIQHLVLSAAKKGTIDRIEVVDRGENYSLNQVDIVITGDGQSATATAVVENGEIIKINITNAGENYTYCEIAITDNAATATRPAVLLDHISPINGHGYNCITELGAFYCIISVDLNGIEQGYFPILSTFRKSGLITNFTDLADNVPSNLRYYGIKHSKWLDVPERSNFPSRFLKDQSGEILYLYYHKAVTRNSTQLERIKLVVETI